VSREQLAVDNDAVLAIAKHCQGQMRDALNLLERVALGAAVPLRPQPVAVDVARELRQTSKLLEHKMSAPQFKVAKRLVDIAKATKSVEVAYPTKRLAKDAGVSTNTARSALVWMVQHGHLAKLDPEPGTKSARWKLLIERRLAGSEVSQKSTGTTCSSISSRTPAASARLAVPTPWTRTF
jgi:hypothetical protein